MLVKRILIGLIVGSLLGLVCILGAHLRSTESIDGWYLFAFWFNRFLMGFVFALLPTRLELKYKIIRGIILGLVVSFAFYSATNYHDFLGFIAGGLYGVILELVFHYTIKDKMDV
ncbi:hypothetical protein KHQ88_01055 [Mycoplasmatota bacterium]|nr:hypothetical protein KHQ88_01055 [Mycoplasmatota bacterium]